MRFAVVLLLLAACGTGESPDAGLTDAGPADAATAPDLDVTPTPPSPPVLTPCPPGWREVTGSDGVVTCDPWPASGYRDDCPFDEAHVPGTPGCARVGTACAGDGWPSDLPSGRPIVYVDDDAAPGGDGATRATALTTIQAGLAAAPNMGVVAIAVGRYDEPPLLLGTGKTLWGACVDGTRLTSSAPAGSAALLQLAHVGAGARNLGVDAPALRGVSVSGSYVTLDAVVISGAVGYGVYVGTGSLTATDLVVRDSRPSTDGTPGGGMWVGGRAMADVTRGIFARNPNIGAQAENARLALHDCASEGNLPEPTTHAFGRGLDVDMAGTLVLERVAVERNHDVGISTFDDGTTIDATDLVVRDSVPNADGSTGEGLELSGGSTGLFTRLWLERNHGVGLSHDDGHATYTDVVVRDTLPRVDTGAGGEAMTVANATTVGVTRGVFAGSAYVALIAQDGGSTLDLTDVAVRGGASRGIEADNGAVVTLTRGVVDHVVDAALFAHGAGSELHATDVAISDVATRAGSDGATGVGVWAQEEATLTLANARIERTHFAGVMAIRAATVTLDHVVVRDVARSDCADTTCMELAGGFGLAAHFDGSLTATSFTIEDAALCGVVVGENDLAQTAVDLTNGVVDRVPVGACVQVDGYDTMRLRNSVQYRGVTVPLQATSYSLPDLATTGG